MVHGTLLLAFTNSLPALKSGAEECTEYMLTIVVQYIHIVHNNLLSRIILVPGGGIHSSYHAYGQHYRVHSSVGCMACCCLLLKKCPIDQQREMFAAGGLRKISEMEDAGPQQ